MSRVILVLSAVAIGLAASGEALAQFYPPAPVPYEGARGAPVPYGGVRAEGAEDYPYVGNRAPPPYRPAPPAREPYQARESYDSRYEDRTGSLPPAEIRPPIAAAPAREPAPVEARQAPWSARPPVEVGAPRGPSTAALPQGGQVATDADATQEPPLHFRRQMVSYPTREPNGTIIIDTGRTYLYFVMGNGQAIRYGIGVGREGFTWAGKERISRMAEWPDWHPPTEMIERQPYLPRFMAGGPGNPMGARALYLGRTIYRIHGTNEPNTIGKFVSSGCIRMLNDDVEDLYQRVSVGTQVVVLPGSPPASAARAPEADASAGQVQAR